MTCRNHPNRLDHAVIRPGRFDVQVGFHDANQDQALRLYKHFYPPSQSAEGISEKSSVTQGQLDDLAAQFADDIFGHGDTEQLRVSMAALQGYLLQPQHKKDPLAAAAGVADWAKCLQNEQKEEEERKAAKRAAKRAAKMALLPTPVSPISMEGGDVE